MFIVRIQLAEVCKELNIECSIKLRKYKVDFLFIMESVCWLQENAQHRKIVNLIHGPTEDYSLEPASRISKNYSDEVGKKPVYI